MARDPGWRRDLVDATRTGLIAGALGAAVLIPLAWPWLAPARKVAPVATSAVAPAVADFAGVPSSPDARRVADWIVAARDHEGLPFVIVDKKDARVYVFDATARLQATSEVLLGAAVGDDSVPGIGERPIEQVRPEERTTPAGRFFARAGRNALGEDVIWIDYAAAVSMHRVRATDPRERRLERLASAGPADNRISYGCINVPAVFFDARLKPLFAGRGAPVYVLPEVKPLQDVFHALRGRAPRGDA
jgi:hypothetical protein